jgi:tetratricopeptide (TPR) repeat protein
MKCGFFHSLRYLFVCLGLMLASSSIPALKAQTSKPINLDKELEEPAPEDRAVSYYHYTLAKLFEDNGDFLKALSEMKLALKYNPNSSAVNVEMAIVLEKTNNTREAIEYAEEAIRLDPQNPDPHWVLASIYSKSQERGNIPRENLQRAIRELEKLRDLTPSDDRIYYDLGGAYFELDEPEKAIQAYEKYQSLSNDSDSGYREIARYYDRKNNPDKAIEYLKKGLATNSDSPESLSMLSLLYTKLNRNKEAIPVYKKLLEVTGNNISISRRFANSLFEAGEYEEAVRVLKNLVTAVPADKASQIQLGRAQIGLRKYPEAIETLQIIIAEDSGATEAQKTEARFYLGRSYEESGKYLDAVQLFSSILDSNSDEVNANRLAFQQHLAANYMELKNYEKAIPIYQEIVKADPKASIQLLDAYRISLQFDKAIPYAKQLFEKDTNDIPMGTAYARTLVDAGKSKEGVEVLSKLLLSNPQNIELYLNLSQLYLQDKRYGDAEKVLRRAEEKKLEGESLERLKIQQAAIYEQQRDFGHATEIFSKLLQSKPENVDYYLKLSQLYLQDKRYSDAEQIIRQAEGKIPDGENSERLKFQRAAVYERQKDFARAESLFKEILKTNPKNAAVLNYIGYMLADRGIRLEEALQYVKEALAIDPRNGAYLDSLGWAFFKLNDLENAEKFLLEADDIVKDDSTIDDHLGDLYFKTGNLQKAQEFWNKSLSIGTEQEDIRKVRRKLEQLQETIRKNKSSK